MSEGQLVQLKPEQILADDNSRFGLKPERVSAMVESIQTSGGILTPVEVEPLRPHKNGFTHRLTAGFYRHAAAAELNKVGAGLLVPAIVRSPADAAERLRHQVTENRERENMSPMDEAIAIKRMLDAGMSRADIRKAMARNVGKKQTMLRPASNAWVNVVLGFLELPKPIQALIHSGALGFDAAYTLGKAPADKQKAIVERALADRESQLEREEADEEKYLEAEAKLTEAEDKKTAAETEAKELEATILSGKEIEKEARKRLDGLKKEPVLTYTKEQQAEHKEKMKAAEADVKGAAKTVKDAQNKLASASKVVSTASEAAATARLKLETARKAAKKPAAKKGEATKPLGKADIQSAAAKEGEKLGNKPLGGPELRQSIKDMLKPVKGYKLSTAVVEIFYNLAMGVTTPKLAVSDLLRVTGEKV